MKQEKLPKRRGKNYIWAASIVVAIIVTSIFAMGMGRFTMSVTEIFATIFPGTLPDVEVSDAMYSTIFNIRLPRVLLALIAGAGLSVAGASFQGVFSNPLATPDTLGVATGASFGAVLGILFGMDMILVQVMALVAGVAAAGLVFSISKIRGVSSIIMIVLAGMVVAALFQSMVSLIKFTADPQDTLPAITFWLMGSLTGTTFETLIVSAPFIIAGVVAIYILRWRLNAMSLHEDEAKSLGINVKRVRIIIILASTMVTAAVVSVCGLIGWVGLLVPHVSRMIFGNDNRAVIPASIGIGALFMLVIDTIARSATASEIPVSILTAVIGAPFFIILLRRTGGIKS